MPEWAMDGSGLRHAHREGVLARVALPQKLTLSPLTWLPAGVPFVPVLTPEVHYPDPGADPPPTPTLFDRPLPEVALCDCIEGLHSRGAVTVTDADECLVAVTVDIEQCWREAGGVGPLIDESVAALVLAQLKSLPLVTADPSVLRVARQRDIAALTVEQFALQLAA